MCPAQGVVVDKAVPVKDPLPAPEERQILPQVRGQGDPVADIGRDGLLRALQIVGRLKGPADRGEHEDKPVRVCQPLPHRRPQQLLIQQKYDPGVQP